MNLLISKKDILEVTKLRGYKFNSHQRRKKNIIRLIRRTSPSGSSILDVGCASGDIAVELSSLGYHIHGIDLEPKRLATAMKLADIYNQKIKFQCKSFQEFNSHESFDIVLLGEVLEHFEDPVCILKEVKCLLNASGSVIITVPNMPSLRNRLKFGFLGIFPDNNPEHKFYFDYYRFKKVSHEAGFKISSWKTSFTDVFYISTFLSLFQKVLLFWFTFLFPKSGDSLIVVISPEKTALSN